MIHSEIPKLIGHRGLKAYAPENTLASIRKAHEFGLQWIEVDVMQTKDGKFVLFHDNTLRRTTNGRGSLHKKTYAQLQTLDAGSWFAPEFAQERIPLLSEALECIFNLGLRVNLELKPRRFKEKEFAQEFLEYLQQNWPPQVPPPLISSFSLRTLKYLKKFNCPYPLAWLLSRWKKRWQRRADEIECVSINLEHMLATLERVAEIKNTHRQVLVYTVNDPFVADKLFQMGVDAIFTDVGDKVLKKEL